MRRLLITLLLLGFTAALPAQDIRLPLNQASLKFAVIGDTGTGDRNQVEVANALTAMYAKVPFEFALMAGDNIYGSDGARDYTRKFEAPYKKLLDAGVKFYASLGNHDDPNQRFYKPFNMNGQRYYTFRPSPLAGVRFFALDSNYMDARQLQWLDTELAASGSDWKIAFFHHPPYSSGGTHGSADLLRDQIEPLFVKNGVSVVFTGHEHFYERIKPQKGIAYFIQGSSAKLRRGDLERSNLTAKGWDEGLTFMLVEIVDDDLTFQVLSSKGVTIDSGVIHKTDKTPAGTRPVTSPATPAPRTAVPTPAAPEKKQV